MVRNVLTLDDIHSYIKQIKFNINTISKKNQKALFSLVSSYLDILKTCHLNYDLCQLGYIGSNSYEETSVISRDWLRKVNQSNQLIQDKYFKDFNIIDFISLVIQKFIFSSNKVLFLYKDSLDTKILEIISTLTRYQLLNDNDFEFLIDLMLTKMPIYRQYEDNIIQGLNDNEIRTSKTTDVKSDRSNNEFSWVSKNMKHSTQMIKQQSYIKQSSQMEQSQIISRKRTSYITNQYKTDFDKYGNPKLDKKDKLEYQKEAYISKIMNNKINYFEVFIQYVCFKMDS